MSARTGDVVLTYSTQMGMEDGWFSHCSEVNPAIMYLVTKENRKVINSFDNIPGMAENYSQSDQNTTGVTVESILSYLTMQKVPVSYLARAGPQHYRHEGTQAKNSSVIHQLPCNVCL